jgi:hypothetical protein
MNSTTRCVQVHLYLSFRQDLYLYKIWHFKNKRHKRKEKYSKTVLKVPNLLLNECHS